jgi:dTDP-4-dehydrorhamnose 3,5-epimerase
MIFTETKLPGAYLVDIEPRTDERGFFARMFCANEFAERQLNSAVPQVNISFNYTKGTLRGMHYQVPPAAETKLVRCLRGAIYDVIIDLRPDSPTFLQHIGVELTAETRTALYIPQLFAHGFQTLADDTEVLYLMGEFYTPGYDRGLRYDDPAFKIAWPLPVTIIAEKDKNWPLFNPTP